MINWQNAPRGMNRTRWMDIADHAGPVEAASGTGGGTEASEGGIWAWLASWFSAEAWSKWWNS